MAHQPLPQSNTNYNNNNNHTDMDAALMTLNNVAIELLSLGNCKCTIDVFKTALTLLKSTTTVDPQQMVQAARARLVAAQAAAASNTDNNVVVLSIHHDAQDAYNLLSNLRTSKVCLTMDDQSTTVLEPSLIRSVLVYNYAIAHRCCGASVSQQQQQANLQSFCLQIFQYAETLLNQTSTTCNNMLFRLVLTRNLMMLSCRLGMSLCQHYKETLDPIVETILGPLSQQEDATKAPAA